MSPEKQLDIAITAATRAGDFLRRLENMTVDSSRGKDIKLSSDKLSESIIVETLSSSNIPILSEESGSIGNTSGRYWIIDPLDGSMNYYKGLDDFSCVSIALWENGGPVLGVINRFARDEIFTGIPCGIAALNG